MQKSTSATAKTTIVNAQRHLLRHWSPPKRIRGYPASIHAVVSAIHDRTVESSDPCFRAGRSELSDLTKLPLRSVRYVVSGLVASGVLTADCDRHIRLVEINWPAVASRVAATELVSLLRRCNDTATLWLRSCLADIALPLTPDQCRTKIIAETTLPAITGPHRGSLLSHKALLLWVHLAPGRDLSTRDIAHMLGSSRRVAQKGLRSLVEAGYIVRAASPVIMWQRLLQDAPADTLAELSLRADDEARSWIEGISPSFMEAA
ncbi:MAG TPA: hypothetical protein DDW52_06750 [Planctomycetaceae bacterium]|nr:hypothetical protein [Planctomycetaceae bacterium]